ncbi:MAG: hypothetical protein Q8P15_01815 [Nanoarchaeota archaeon]|nr:hypothetical protein [Nanoarchaeota archaeon]
MNKKIIFFVIVLLIIPSISALNLKVEKQSSDEVLIIASGIPAVFDLQIKNLGSTEDVYFYNLLGFDMQPKGMTELKGGETTNVQLKISPIGEIGSRGYYTMQYYIRGTTGEIKQELTFKIIDLKEVFDVGTGEIDPGANSIEIYLYNKVNSDFGNVKAEFSSLFFRFTKEFSLGPKEKKTFEIELKPEDFNKLIAGFYTVKAEINTGEKTITSEGTLKFAEKNLLVTSEENYGFIIYTKIIEKANKGNTIEKTETTIKKNILSRLFTTLSPEPDYVEKKGFNVYYTWSSEVKPGETLKVTVKTNWFFPLLIIFFIVVIVISVKKFSKTNLILRKKISFVNAKGGEFALKVSIFVKAKKYIQKVNLTDRLPPLTKIYERFSGEKPSKIDEKNRKLEWYFEKLAPGETRVISYIIYSKIGVLGRFALPPATAIFEKDGDFNSEESNRAYFVTEQRGKEETDE